VTSSRSPQGLYRSATDSVDGTRVGSTLGVLTDEATITPDVNEDGTSVIVTLAASRTMADWLNLDNGATFCFIIVQGGSGSYELTWNAAYDFGAAGEPTLSTAVGKEDVVTGIKSSSGKLLVSFRGAAA